MELLVVETLFDRGDVDIISALWLVLDALIEIDE